jgi:hypothetical protein
VHDVPGTLGIEQTIRSTALLDQHVRRGRAEEAVDRLPARARRTVRGDCFVEATGCHLVAQQ